MDSTVGAVMGIRESAEHAEQRIRDLLSQLSNCETASAEYAQNLSNCNAYVAQLHQQYATELDETKKLEILNLQQKFEAEVAERVAETKQQFLNDYNVAISAEKQKLEADAVNTIAVRVEAEKNRIENDYNRELTRAQHTIAELQNKIQNEQSTPVVAQSTPVVTQSTPVSTVTVVQPPNAPKIVKTMRRTSQAVFQNTFTTQFTEISRILKSANRKGLLIPQETNKKMGTIYIKRDNKSIKYTAISYLGGGSFGNVWKVNEISTDNDTSVTTESTRALKRMNVANKNVAEDIKLEITGLKELGGTKCTNFATCLVDFFEHDGYYYIVMDYIEGFELLDVINIVPYERRRHMYSVPVYLCAGLYELHKDGTTHQDIKPENIMFGKNIDKKHNTVATPKFVDWGSACINSIYCGDANNCVKPCGFIGTQIYSPHEVMKPFLQKQAANKTPDIYAQGNFANTVAHDIWSLGVTLLYWYNYNEKSPVIYDDLYKADQNRIDNILSGVSEDFPRNLLRLMLEIDPQTRIDNWVKIMKLIEPYNAELKEFIRKQ